MAYLLGLDVSTTGSKALLIDETGAVNIVHIRQTNDDSISVIAVGTIDLLSSGTGVVINAAAGSDEADILLWSEAGDVDVNDVVTNSSANAASGIALDADGTNSDETAGRQTPEAAPAREGANDV